VTGIEIGLQFEREFDPYQYNFTQGCLTMSEVDYVKRESEDVLNADHFESEESDWQAQKELALLNAISKCKPVGKFTCIDQLARCAGMVLTIFVRYAQTFSNHKYSASI
jgi:hypothetical protein